MVLLIQVALLVALVGLTIFVARQARLVLGSRTDAPARVLPRLTAVVVLGMTFAFLIRADLLQHRSAGKQAFLESQASRFDSFILKPHSVVGDAVFGILFVGVAAGAYELVAWLVGLASRPRRKHGAA